MRSSPGHRDPAASPPEERVAALPGNESPPRGGRPPGRPDGGEEAGPPGTTASGKEVSRASRNAGGRGWWLAAVFSAAALALPFLLVRFPPCTDLPQQLAQIPLFLQAVTDPASGLHVQWLAPNKLSYLILGLAWAMASPLGAASLSMILLALVWAGSVHGFARRRRRAAPAAVLACVFFFNQSLYWGFLNFLVGLPAFFVFLHLTDPEQMGPRPLPGWVRGFLGSLLLYEAHALWFAAGALWFGVERLVRRRSLKRAFDGPFAGILATAALAAAWYPSLAAHGWGSYSRYGPYPPWRLDPWFWMGKALGGVHGTLEPVALGAITGWILLGLVQNRGRLRGASDGKLLGLAAFFFILALVLPIKVEKTLIFASRWLPMAWTFLVLGVPRPRLRPALAGIAASGVLAAFVISTSLIWVEFDRIELAGLEESLEQIPDGAAVLGLDFVRESPRIQPPPYFQLPAYSQVLHGGTLGFSFSQHASSLVVDDTLGEVPPWTVGLEWFPQLLRMSDLRYFDRLLVHAAAPGQEILLRDPRVTAVTEAKPWRLMKVAGGGGEASGQPRPLQRE